MLLNCSSPNCGINLAFLTGSDSRSNRARSCVVRSCGMASWDCTAGPAAADPSSSATASAVRQPICAPCTALLPFLTNLAGQGAGSRRCREVHVARLILVHLQEHVVRIESLLELPKLVVA